MAVFNTEVFKVKSVEGFKGAIDRLTPALTEEGATDVRVFRQIGDGGTVIITAWWPTAEACRAFAQNHEEDFMNVLMPEVTNAEPEYLWEQV